LSYFKSPGFSLERKIH